ncbi:DUF4238 domain-containing protein [Prescottella equi]|uniref:DUF4238 domain-containing protein n=1 Tax=Rhodococcus hoagii TaxID=43767 RepID=UPI001C797055|nr:DUF4238 domain-containing protein [Prescottella equi]BCN51608.1 hypothetical protein RE9416_49090 [Prescottella equi]BCN56628.1 hypothetical protein RE9425_50180 [Prescottella equi]BCN61543.1 hypothetical protein RE9427_49130 [Prescottella equi]BCN86346.1 hypothetical protein RE0356_49870 [Prescottella equi]
MEAIAAGGFEHRWLSDEFVAESLRLGGEEQGKEHHYVPQMYLKRWTVGGRVQPVLVDRRQVLPPQRPKEVAKKTNLYSLPAADSMMDQPLRWIEKHLSRIEGECAGRLDQLERWGAGVISEDDLKRDLSVFLALQVTRTVSNRERSLLLINGPVGAKREFYRRFVPRMSDADFQAMLANTCSDPKTEAINLMFADVRNGLARCLYEREWAVYRTAAPLVTCDDPVVFVAGPPYSRDITIGAKFSAAALYPLGPEHLLVMLRPGLRHSGRYALDQEETRGVNYEIVAAAASMVFEQPGDDIAAHLEVPARTATTEMDDDQVGLLDDAAALRHLLNSVTPRSRWAGVLDAPGWPVRRWYSPTA